MAKVYLRVDVPDELLIEFHQAIRDFDMKHDPDRVGRVHFETLTESDFPTEKMAAVFKQIAPPFKHVVVKTFKQNALS